MKKLFCILLVIVMFVSVCSITVSADTYYEFPEVGYNYYDIMVERYGKPLRYGEFCYYSDETNEEPDWVLICHLMDVLMWGKKHGAFVEDRLLWTMGGVGPREFTNGYALYFPDTDELVGLEEDNVERIFELCPEFLEVLEEYEFGQLIGDINEDNKIDILDATYIQRVLADMYVDYATTVRVVNNGYSMDCSIMDFDRDGEVSIMDATAIQRKLAGLE